jgi:hypothetical protein
MECLDRQYQLDLVKHAVEQLRRNPREQIAYARDRKGVRHMVAFLAWRQAWCGVELTEPRSKRTRSEAGSFPIGVCEACRKVYAEVKEKSDAHDETAE